jgi:hypothetical protein
MKQIYIILLVATLSVIIVGCASQSSMNFGDKPVGDVLEAKKAINAQIKDYQDRVIQYQEENERLANRLPDCESIQDSITRAAVINLRLREMAHNDSLASDYRKKISRLESQTDEILVRGVGKDKINSVVLNGYDAGAVADAYATVKYVNDAGTESCINARRMNAVIEKDVSGLRAILENTCYYSVIAQITGPVGFYREFKIKAYGFSSVFSLPVPGNYTTTFINCNNESDYALVTKHVGPNIFYYVDNEVYDYKATAILR